MSHGATIMNSALVGEHFISATKIMLERYDNSYEKIRGWGSAFATLFWNTFYACARESSCRSAEHTVSLIRTVGDFIHNNINWLDKPANDYHLHNLGYQLANMYSGKNDPHFSQIKI